MIDKLRFHIFTFLLVIAAQVSLSAGGPENLVLVVNSESQSSLLIANHYIALRDVPAPNIIYLDGIPNREVIQLKDFKSLILGPLLKTMQQRQLKNIDYIVYSADFPAVVNIGPHQKKLIEQAKEQGNELSGNAKKLFHPYASINALTYYADAVMNDEPGYMLLDSNYYYRNATGMMLSDPFTGQPQINFEYATKTIRDGDFDEGISVLMELGKEHPLQMALSYWLARAHAGKGEFDVATKWLERSVKQGWQYRSYTEKDPAFKDAIKDDNFKASVEKIAPFPYKQMPTQGFKRGFAWSKNGSVNSSPEFGRRYFLSTILAVTRNYGCSEQDALASLERSAGADSTFPEGNYFFTTTKDIRTKTRKQHFNDVVAILNNLGMNAEVVGKALPINRRGLMGVTMGTAKFNWKASRNQFLPGAIGDNLTSYGGKMNAQPQTKCTDYIAGGAAGASGTVFEPFAIQQKFPHPMIHVHYALGCTLAEAFYQSVHGPFQLLIVGDALCQPFARVPTFTCNGLAADQIVSGKVEAQLNFEGTPVPIKVIELYVDGKLANHRPFSNRVAFDSTVLSDGYHELRIVAVADNSLLSTGRLVIPVVVNNKDKSVSLDVDSNRVPVTGKVSCQIKSNYGSRIELRHNGRVLGEAEGARADFEFAASTLGRGPVKLVAVAIGENGGAVSSVPVELEITGTISSTLKMTEPKPRNKKK